MIPLFFFYFVLLLMPASAIALACWWGVSAISVQADRRRGLDFLSWSACIAGLLSLLQYVMMQWEHIPLLWDQVVLMLVCLAVIFILTSLGKHRTHWGSGTILLMLAVYIWREALLNRWIMPLLNRDYLPSGWSYPGLEDEGLSLTVATILLLAATFAYAKAGFKKGA